MAGTEPPHLTRRRVLTSAAAVAVVPAARARAAADRPFTLSGRPEQGGALIGRTRPGAPVAVNGAVVGAASPEGLFVVGLDRDEAPQVLISVLEGTRWNSRPVPVRAGVWDVQRIDGLPPEQVSPTAPELLQRIAREAETKAKAFASEDAGDGFSGGFAAPVAATRMSSSFGGQRILNGQAGRPHYGVDLAAPLGTPIAAPADGLVVLAEPDMHFEGGLTFIDHGQGLVAMFLHQSRLDVRAGDRVSRGQVIGAVGQTGRTTGPHLCWRLKWRNRNMNPSLLIGVSAPEVGADSPNLFNSA